MDERLRRTRRRAALAAAVLATALAAGAWLGPPRIEQAIRARIEREAAERGLAARVEAVRVGLGPLLSLSGLHLERPGAWSLAFDRIEATLRPWGRGVFGRIRLALSPMTLVLPAGLALEAGPTRWDMVAVGPERMDAELLEPATGLTLEWRAAPDGGRVEARATDLPAGRLLVLRRDGVPWLDAGVVSGTLRVALGRGLVTIDVDARGRGVRLAALASADPAAADEAPAFGLPTEAALRAAGSWRPPEGELAVPRWRLVSDGAVLSGSLTVADLPRDPRLELSLEAERVDFARLLGSVGLGEPEALAAPAAGGGSSLGSASLSAHMSGRLADPASFVVSQRLDFTPPDRPLPALERLRGDFVHEAERPGGKHRTILVSPASPDFIPLAEVPPLFVRAMLLGEDSGFFSHRGIDLSELPSALLANWRQGEPARGASTITQQLAKNLFLSREKRLGRKLQELSLALLLEATLDKERILEIYLNVIEWGPDLYGLRPASRCYFSKEPRELTPRQMAFLVALVPGPLKYQRSFAGGTLSPGFLPLVDDLLAKLCLFEALTEEQYQVALAEELRVNVEPCLEGAP